MGARWLSVMAGELRSGPIPRCTSRWRGVAVGGGKGARGAPPQPFHRPIDAGRDDKPRTDCERIDDKIRQSRVSAWVVQLQELKCAGQNYPDDCGSESMTGVGQSERQADENE